MSIERQVIVKHIKVVLLILVGGFLLGSMSAIKEVIPTCTLLIAIKDSNLSMLDELRQINQQLYEFRTRQDR